MRVHSLVSISPVPEWMLALGVEFYQIHELQLRSELDHDHPYILVQVPTLSTASNPDARDV